jgi:DNA-binding MarR family transcriptional regulator
VIARTDRRPPGSVGLLLSQVGRSVAHGFHARLEALGLDPRQYLLLQAVGASPAQSQQAVGSSLRIPPSRMVGLVDSLEARGLLERVPNPADRRVHALRLTAAGRGLLARAEPLAEAYEAEVCAPLDQNEQATLAELLTRIATGRDARRARPTGGTEGPAAAPGRGRHQPGRG